MARATEPCPRHFLLCVIMPDACSDACSDPVLCRCPLASTPVSALISTIFIVEAIVNVLKVRSEEHTSELQSR